jgi:hypothetical protein
VELVQFDLVKEKESWRIWLLGYLGRGHSTLLGSSRRCFGGTLIYFGSRTISPRGGRNLGVDPLMGRAQASIFN